MPLLRKTVPPSVHSSKWAGFSLPEVLTTIVIIGILAGICLQSYRGIQTSAREGVAHDTLALLNRGVLLYNQANWDIVLDPISESTTDEIKVLRTLQWRNPDASQATPGSPYISGNISDATSSSDQDYRIQWNGHMFELLSPGTAGAGILTGQLSPGTSSTPTFSSDYQPLGRNQHE